MNGDTKPPSSFFESAYTLETGEQTKDHYRQWAASYDSEIGGDNGYIQPQRCADALIRHLVPAENQMVLDCGCGTGLSGVALKAAGYGTIDGCDFSPEMLKIAEEKRVYRHLFPADLNAGLPSIADNTCDAVCAVGVFSFGHVLPDACDHMLRVLKPEKYLVIALNEHYWDEGALPKKLDELVDAGSISIEEKEFGGHLPGKDVNGWVIVVRKQK